MIRPVHGSVYDNNIGHRNMDRHSIKRIRITAVLSLYYSPALIGALTPKTIVPEAVSCRNFDETRSIPATSRSFRQGLQWNRPELCGKTEAVFPPEFPRTGTDDIPHISVTGMSTDAAVSDGNHYGIIPISDQK